MTKKFCSICPWFCCFVFFLDFLFFLVNFLDLTELYSDEESGFFVNFFFCFLDVLDFPELLELSESVSVQTDFDFFSFFVFLLELFDVLLSERSTWKMLLKYHLDGPLVTDRLVVALVPISSPFWPKMKELWWITMSSFWNRCHKQILD